MRRFKPSLFVFLVSLLFGYLMAIGSWEGLLFVYLGEHRAPAAVRSLQDYSAFDRKAMFASIHEQMLQEASLVRQQDMLAITLGHPLFKKAGGTGDFACAANGRPGLFDRVEMTFVGTGISESGEQPVMIVDAKCSSGDSLKDLRTIWVPMQEIINSEPKDQELQYFGDQAVNIRLSQIPGQWPDAWALDSVRMFRDGNPDESYTLDSALIREARGAAFTFDWK